jgi:hypothetical protein
VKVTLSPANLLMGLGIVLIGLGLIFAQPRDDEPARRLDGAPKEES